jgi:colanic acid/amylovoran biosynthesis glycosyltransferase
LTATEANAARAVVRIGADTRVGYVTAEYPAPSHTFVLREVQALRRLGLPVETFSIRRTPPERLLSAVDRAEHERTYSVLPARPGMVVRAHAHAFRTSPRRYVETLRVAMQRSPPGLRARLWQLFYFAEAMIVWRRSTEMGLDHLHAHFGNVASDVTGLAARFGLKVRQGPRSWSMTVHGSSEFYELGLNRLVDKVTDASFVVCVSDFGRSQLLSVVEEHHWAKIHVIHCGVDPDHYQAVPAPSEDGGPRDRPFRLLMVGRLVSVKGPSVLVEALSHLKRAGREVDAVLVGDGPRRARLERMAEQFDVSDRVTFAGAVGQDVMREFYVGADVFCLPSFFEGLPVVLMEAMAMELPVVTTAITGVPELVEDGRSGLLVRPGRADLLAEAIARMQDSSPEERRAMGRAGRERVLAEFDVSDSARRLRSLFTGSRPDA